VKLQIITLINLTYLRQKNDTHLTDVIQVLLQHRVTCWSLVELASSTKAGPGEVGCPGGDCCTAHSTDRRHDNMGTCRPG